MIETVVDLPFAVSPVVVGVVADPALGASTAGSAAWRDHGIRVIFSMPGMVIATIFVTLPFVVREVEPVLHEIGDEQEQAAATLGASLAPDVLAHHAARDPLGPPYGVVLTVARSLGEFGALIVVAGGVSGESQTLTLLVHARYIDDHNDLRRLRGGHRPAWAWPC